MYIYFYYTQLVNTKSKITICIVLIRKCIFTTKIPIKVLKRVLRLCVSFVLHRFKKKKKYCSLNVTRIMYFISDVAKIGYKDTQTVLYVEKKLKFDIFLFI